MENKKQPSISANYVFNTLQQFVTLLLPLITSPYVSRMLSPSGIGSVSYVTANVTYFTLIGTLGISGYGQREIALVRSDKKKTSKLFWELETLHIVMFLITLCAYIVVIISSSKYRVLYLVNLFTLFGALIDVSWFYQAYERYRFIAIRNCVIKICYTVLIFVFVKDEGDFAVYALLQVLGTFIGNLSLLPKLKDDLVFIPVKELRWQRHFKEVLIYFIPSIAASVYSLLDKSVINWITQSDEQNGYYEQASKVVNICHIVVQSLSTVSAARMTLLLADNQLDAARDRMEKSLRYMLLIAMPCAWGIAGIANRFVPLFFGQGYDVVEILLYTMAPLVVICGFSVYVDGMYLVPSGQRGKSAIAVCIGAGSNLVLNSTLVYFLQAEGAAIATVITELLVTTLMVLMAKPILKLGKISGYILKYGALSALIFVIARIIGSLISNDLMCVGLQILVCAGFYFTVLVILKDEMVYELLDKVKSKFKIQK